MKSDVMGSIMGQFWETGLILFGDFLAADGRRPFMTRFELLASYPDVLAMCAQASARLVAAHRPSRLLCSADAMPFAMALALQTGTPLVYSRGGHGAAVEDLVGAFDIGHETLLIVNVVDEHTATLPWVVGARRVGLETIGIVALMEARSPHPSLPAQALARLSDMATALAAHGLLPPGQAQMVMDWVGR